MQTAIEPSPVKVITDEIEQLADDEIISWEDSQIGREEFERQMEDTQDDCIERALIVDYWLERISHFRATMRPASFRS